MNDDGAQIMKKVVDQVEDAGAIVTVQHPDFGEILKLSDGQVVVPLDACMKVLAEQVGETAARVENLEARLWREEADNATLKVQRDEALARLPGDDSLGEAYRASVVTDNQQKSEQLGEVHKLLAKCLAAVNPIVDQVEEGAAVVVTGSNEHGKAVIGASEAVGEYADRLLA